MRFRYVVGIILDINSLHIFYRHLHHWYSAHGRKDLPWRNTGDAYAIYISEIMLQQTQVATVRERYYTPFLKSFPTLAALAAAQQDKVLQAWQGLGYYNRAINLQKAARLCDGTLPRTVDALMELPGIGRNTAHAIAAFAYHQPVAVMEANVRRVLSRIFALSDPRDEELWERADLLLDKQSPFDFNQAMMDIGALVCTRRNPRCGECPAADICMGKSSPESYPAAKQKKSVPVRTKHIAVFKDKNGQYYASPRESRFLHGLYHFIEVDRTAAHVEFDERQHALAKARKLGHVRQQYSHFTLEADIWLMESGTSKNNKNWYSLDELEKLPVSAAETKAIKLLKSAA